MTLTNLIAGVLLAAALFLRPQQQNDIPSYDHVVLVMEENHAYSEVIGSEDAPYINQLAKNGVLCTNSHGIGHPSQPNYLVLYSGSTQGVTGDECLEGKTPYKTPNMGAALLDKKLSFRGYAETMPKAGYLGCGNESSSVTIGRLYARKHTPWVNWVGAGVNCIPPAWSVPMTDFPKDFTKLPTVCFVVPNMDYDMHNIGIKGDDAAIRRADTWLKEHLGAYAEWAKTHNSLLIVTWDEDDFMSKNENKIATIFYGAKLIPGKYDKPMNHYNTLHTIESMYGLPLTDNVVAPPIGGIWTK